MIRTGAGLKTCELKLRDSHEFEFRSSMGAPEIGGDLTVDVKGGRVTGIPVSMGNPHFVAFVSEFEPGWQTVAEQIRCTRTSSKA